MPQIKKIKKYSNPLSLALLIFAVLFITLPFIGKAFHLDDTILVRLAELKLKDPLAVGLPDYGFGGDFYSLYLDTHPPLVASYLSFLIWIFGGPSEVWLHIGFMLFPAIAAVSMFFLAKRFTGSQLTAALLLVVSPGFMVMSQSIMTDIPNLAFWLATITSYVYGVDRKKRGLLVLATAFMALALLTTYQSLSLVPLLLAYAFLKRRVSVRNMIPLGAGLAVFGGVFLFHFLVSGGLPRLSYSIGLNMSAGFVANKILASISVIGGAIVFPAVIAAGMLKGKKEYLFLSALFGTLLVFFFAKAASGQYTAVAAVLQAVFYSAGLLAIYRFLSAGTDAVFPPQRLEKGGAPRKKGGAQWATNAGRQEKDGDTIFLSLWMFGVLAYSVLLLPYASTRYLLPLFPPVILMFVRYARTVFAEKRNWIIFSAVAVVFTAAAGMATSIADYQLSGVYRDFSSTYPQKLRTGNQKIWLAGEFGLRYYLEENGASYLTREDNSPVAGDYVVLSHNLIAYYLSDELKNRLTLSQNVEYPTGWPVRVYDRGSQAGFYGQFQGYLPYSVSSQPVESIDIYVVK